MGLGFKIRKGNRVAYGISIPFPMPLKPWSSRRRFFSHFASFHFTHDKLSERGLPPKLTSAKTASSQKRTYCACSCASRINAFIRKKKCSEPKFQECKDAKSFEINCQVCLRAILLSIKRKKRKQYIHCLQKGNDNHLYFTYLLPIKPAHLFGCRAATESWREEWGLDSRYQTSEPARRLH